MPMAFMDMHRHTRGRQTSERESRKLEGLVEEEGRRREWNLEDRKKKGLLVFTTYFNVVRKCVER
jgi:hypothetical protein